MPFGLKKTHAKPTITRKGNFRGKNSKTIAVSIDDMFVKSLRDTKHMHLLEEHFEILNKYHMKVNPSKCSFGVSSKKFLGYFLTQREIEANPDQLRYPM